MASFLKNSFPLGSTSIHPIMFSLLPPCPKDNTYYEKCLFMPDVIVSIFFFFFCHVPETLLSGLSVFVCAFALLIIYASRRKYDVLRCVILRVKLETQQANLPVAYFSKSTLRPREWVLSGKESQQEEWEGHFYITYSLQLSPCFSWAPLWSPFLLAVTDTSQRGI